MGNSKYLLSSIRADKDLKNMLKKMKTSMKEHLFIICTNMIKVLSGLSNKLLKADKLRRKQQLNRPHNGLTIQIGYQLILRIEKIN